MRRKGRVQGLHDHRAYTAAIMTGTGTGEPGDGRPGDGKSAVRHGHGEAAPAAHVAGRAPAGRSGPATHAGHGAHAPRKSSVTWSMAASATLHCLTGCAVGEVLGMLIGAAFAWPALPTAVLAIALAFLFGYSLTVLGLRRARLGLRRTVRLALAADTLSIAVMELVDNGVLLLVPGAFDAEPADLLFWGGLAFSLLVAFAVTTPVNKWLIGRGRGHAVIHGHH